MKLTALFHRLRRLTLTARIAWSMGLGVVVGLFFGEDARALQPLADVYLRLMQMTVLPYLVAALILGFGQLRPHEASLLARRGGLLLFASWAAMWLVLVAAPFAFPPMETATFFSSAIVEPHRPVSFADLYFTSNPFHSLSNAVVPAVVLFCSLFGLGLMGVPDREKVLGGLRVVSAAIIAITRGVVALTPLGLFAIVAVTAGTLGADVLSRLEVYLLTFSTASVLLTFLVLPVLAIAVTPLRYREVLAASRDALLTAFVASSAFVVMPMIIERSKELLEKRGLRTPEGDGATDVLVPVLFNFPAAGKLLTLLFVPFAAWLSGTPFGVRQSVTLLLTGLPAYLAKAQVALPFLMDQYFLPQDLFQLYLPTTLLTGKLDAMVSAMNLMVFALLASTASTGAVRLERTRVLRASALGLGGLVLGFVALAVVLRVAIDTTYRNEAQLADMVLHRDFSSAVVHRPGEALPPARSGAVLTRVRESGRLRVGYDPHNVPFSFFNRQNALVGFDVELAAGLADSLGAAPEFVPVTWGEVAARLDDGTIDVMPGVWYRPYWFRTQRLSRPYFVETMGFAVLDHRREEFSTVEGLRASSGLKIGVNLDPKQYAASIARYFEGSDAQFVVADPQRFFSGGLPELDAFLTPVEGAAASTLLHPQYTVVVPQPDPITVPVSFAMAKSADALAIEIDEWITFAESEGTLRRAGEQWIFGNDAKSRRRRWSFAADVLGW